MQDDLVDDSGWDHAPGTLRRNRRHHDGTPPCMNVAMSTIDANNAESVGSGFVLNTEVEKFAPCAFVTGKNPITGEACVESFLTANAKLRNKHNRKSKRKKRYHLIQKPLANVYTALVGSLLIYIIYNLTKTK